MTKTNGEFKGRVRDPNDRVVTAIATLTVMGETVVVWAARCPPPCSRLVMGVPGSKVFEVRVIQDGGSFAAASGRGPIIVCPRCGGLVEVIQHKEAA